MIRDTEKIVQARAYIDYRLRDEAVDMRKACVFNQSPECLDASRAIHHLFRTK